MRRIFACGRGACVAAACAAAFLFTFSDRALSQLLDPGWQLVYPGQAAYGNGGTVGNMFVDGAPSPVGVYQRPPMYYQAMPQRAYQPAPMYYQMPQPRAYQSAPLYYQQAQQPRGYQPAPVYYQQAQQPRGYQPAPVYYQQAQQPRGYQSAPVYYQQAAAPQMQAYRPATTYTQQPAPQYYASASPQQVRAAQTFQQPQYAQPAQSLGAYQTGQYAQAAPTQAAYQQQPSQYQQPAPQANGFAFLFHTPAPAVAPPAYAPPAYAPSSYGDMAHAPVDPRYDRQVVEYQGGEQPGTVIIDTPHYFLYLVMDGGRALRYGIGVGRPGFSWSGVKEVSAMREWPDWYPPPEMLERRPDLPRYMPGGPENPLGARALYLGSTLYRIHGSNEPWTIGTQVSSGCIRLRNEDVIDLYGRVKVGTRVIVI
jgi:lipoprotein-anchoring transpeptidase ErfK/SrfK